MLKFKMALIGLLFALSGCPDVDQYKEDQLVDVGVIPDAGPPVQPQPDAVPAPDSSTLTDAGTLNDVSVDDATSPVGDTAVPLDDAALADGSVVVDGSAPVERCDVTFTVGLPADTPDGSIYLAGKNLVGAEWEPNVEAHTLLRDNGEASITLQLAHLSRVEYKYTRGSWMTVERTANCDELPNRFQLVDCTEAPIILADQVATWADTCSP